MIEHRLRQPARVAKLIESGEIQAVMAFQKVNGLGRDGVAGPQTRAKLAAPVQPAPMVAGGGSTRVEVSACVWTSMATSSLTFMASVLRAF